MSQNRDAPLRVDLNNRPHAVADKGSRFGITALCGVTSSASNARLRFVSGGCGGADKSLYLWTVRAERQLQSTAEMVRLPTRHTSAVNALAYMPSKDLIISGGTDSRIVVTDVGAEEVLQSNVLPGNEVYQVHLADAGGVRNVVLCEASLSF